MKITQSIKYLLKLVLDLIEVLLLPLVILVCLLSRLRKNKIDIGLGPEPLINNIHHKKALQSYGYTAETFVDDVYYITNEFDFIFNDWLKRIFGSKSVGHYVNKIAFHFCSLSLFLYSVWKFKCLYFYFNGGPLGVSSRFLWRIEPFLYKLAGVKIVLMPYGGDVQDLLRTKNLMFRHVMSLQYPEHRFRRMKIAKKIDLWTWYGDHIIGGCDWVEYLFYWDTLMLAHFSIDTDRWQPKKTSSKDNGNLKILHAPNHRHIKGTDYFIDAVNSLKEEGYPVELLILERLSNEKIKEAMASADVVADQLIIGWYAMFAIEAMALGKPVICYLRDDLIRLYENAQLIDEGEIPIINCTVENVKDKIKDLIQNRESLKNIGELSQKYVRKHHSTNAIGKVFDSINKQLKL